MKKLSDLLKEIIRCQKAEQSKGSEANVARLMHFEELSERALSLARGKVNFADAQFMEDLYAAIEISDKVYQGFIDELNKKF